ncbi:hypothetical protein [Amycolatopsis sp. NPDC054798]
MTSLLRLLDGRYALVATERVGSAGEEEGGDVDVQRFAGLDVAVDFGVDSVPQQGPAVPVVVLDVVPGVQEFPQAWQVFMFDGFVSC